MANLVKVDGSMLEGGGQILRYSSAIAAITGLPVAVDSIRAGRAKPGLQPQHLTGLKLVESICRGRLEGGTKGSCSIVLSPGAARCGSYTADTQTAGSCTLMLQASMPVCVFARPPEGAGPGSALGPSTSGRHASELELRGGTDADMAPPVGYLTEVLVPLLRSLYGDLLQGLDVRLVRRGFYPRGGGVLTARVPALPPGTPLPPIDLTTRGNITQVTIRAFSAGRLPATVAKRLAASAESAIRRVLKALGPAGRGVPVLVEAVAEPQDRAVGDGCGVLLIAETDTGCRLGASAKGQRGVPAEEVGEQAAAELGEALTSGTCVDQWMQDQLIIWMALAAGVSRVRCSEPTLHTRTAMVVAEALLPGAKFVLHRPPGAADGGGGGAGAQPSGGGGPAGLWVIEATGAGWVVGQQAMPPNS